MSAFRLALLAGLVAWLIGAPTPATASIGEGVAADRMMTGLVIGKGGTPVVGAAVEATLESWRGDDVISELPLGRATTDAAGEFELIGQAPAEATRNPDGSVAVLLRVVTASTEKYFVVNARPPADSVGAWTWGDQVDRSVLTATMRSTASSLAGERVTGLQLDVAEAPGVAPKGQPRPAARRADKITREECYNSTTYYLHWIFSGRNEDRMMPIQKLDTQRRSRAKLIWQNSRNSTFTNVFKAPGHPAYSLGLTSSRKQVSSAGLSWKSKNKFHGLYRLNWRYRKYVQYCTTSALADTPKELRESDAAVRTGKSRWRPYQWLGGNEPYSLFDSFYCYDGIDPQRVAANRLWVARKTIHRLNAVASLAGVGLASQQRNSKLHKVVYLKDNDAAYMLLCGNDGSPVKASLVREVDY